MAVDGPVTLRYFKYPGCSSNTISLSKLSLGSASKALVNAPGPVNRNVKGVAISQEVQKRGAYQGKPQ